MITNRTYASKEEKMKISYDENVFEELLNFHPSFLQNHNNGNVIKEPHCPTANKG